jgi:hypothetical protein
MKCKLLRPALLLVPFALLANAATAQGADWVACGTINQMSGTQLPNYPSVRYEYGIAYNGAEPLPAICTDWNRGFRCYNKQPYFVFSDNPAVGMQWGGFVFYTGTDASDDNLCLAGQWRHRYWWINSTGAISTGSSNGCYGSELTLYCRRR